MPLSTFHFLIFTLATQLPELPEGPSLENVRGPIESGGGYEIWQIALAILTGLLIAGLFVWLYLRSRKQPATPIDPHAAALAELEAASQATDDERFAMLCANAIRRLIASRFDLPATSQTSSELCAHLPLQREETIGISEFLERCDGVKFAGQTLGSDHRIALLDTAKELIHLLENKEAAA